MAGGIVLTDVGFDFGDYAAGQHRLPPVDEDFAEQFARDVERRAVVERARQRAQDGRRAAAPRRAAARAAACETRGSASRASPSTIAPADWSPETPSA